MLGSRQRESAKSRGIAHAVTRFDTHEVFNQSPPYENVDLFSSDAPLRGGGRGERRERQAAALPPSAGNGEPRRCSRLAGTPTRTRRSSTTFDAKGFRRDIVEFHPAYHELMRASVAAGLHASTWTAAGERAAAPAEVARARAIT